MDSSEAPPSSNLRMRKRRAPNNSVPVAPMEVPAPPPPKRARKVQDSTAAVLKQLCFSGPFNHQNWSLPSTMIYYITKNPSLPKSYQKLVQSCKYFYAENPISIVKVCIKDKTKWRVICVKKSYDMKNISSKIWITTSFVVRRKRKTMIEQTLVASMIPKIYRCDAERLDFDNQTISYQDFLFLTKSIKELDFHNVTVKYEDGTILSCENIVAAIPKAVKISIDSGITSEAFKELLKLPHFSKLKYVVLKKIPETFDIEAFYVYMKTNNYTKFMLLFNFSIPQVYHNRIQEIKDEMERTENHGYKVPIISY